MSEDKLIEWSPRYMLGVEIIDEQHEKLVDIINLFFNAFRKGQAKNIAEEVIVKLVDYTKYHFAVEEKYFAEFKYEGMENHENEHNSFVEKIQAFQTAHSLLFYLEQKKDHIRRVHCRTEFHHYLHLIL